MLAFIADPRTGLGYKRSFTISNFELMKQLPQLLRTQTVEEILNLSDFQELTVPENRLIHGDQIPNTDKPV